MPETEKELRITQQKENLRNQIKNKYCTDISIQTLFFDALTLLEPRLEFSCGKLRYYSIQTKYTVHVRVNTKQMFFYQKDSQTMTNTILWSDETKIEVLIQPATFQGTTRHLPNIIPTCFPLAVSRVTEDSGPPPWVTFLQENNPNSKTQFKRIKNVGLPSVKWILLLRQCCMSY